MRPGSRPRPAGHGPLLAAVAAGALALAGCADDPAAPELTAGPSAPPVLTQAWAELAARAAAAQDRRFTALYTLSTPGTADRTVVVTAATDATWRVDIPAGALGGTADVAVARTADGLFQCGLPSAQRPEQASCVRVADPDGRLPARADPQVHHPFTDWADILTDRQAALSVSAARPLPGVRGSCYSVESTLASLNAPLDTGIYCYADDGLLTGARLSFGTLALLGDPATAPASVALPGPVVDGEPLGMQSPPPPPTPTPTVQPSASTPAG